MKPGVPSAARYQWRLLDLLIVTLLVAVHLAHFPLAVDHSQSNFDMFIPLTPTLIAVWLQLRLNLSTLRSTMMHYITCVIWAYLYSYGLDVNYNRHGVSSPFYRPVESPATEAFVASKRMAIQAFVTSGIYFLVLGMIRRWRSRRASLCEPKTGTQNLEH